MSYSEWVSSFRSASNGLCKHIVSWAEKVYISIPVGVRPQKTNLLGLVLIGTLGMKAFQMWGACPLPCLVYRVMGQGEDDFWEMFYIRCLQVSCSSPIKGAINTTVSTII